MAFPTSTMALVNFKLTEINGLTRRVSFPEKPSWHAFAAKVEMLYGIPLEKVSVSYVDADNDQVTLSSQQELDDFYATTYIDGQVIKFTVQNLPITRFQRTLSHNQPRNAGAFDIEDGWQTLPMPPLSEFQGLFLSDMTEKGHQTHGFVETLDSDRDTAKDEGTARNQNSPLSLCSSPFIPSIPSIGSLDKGKQKAVVTGNVSSTESVLAEDAPSKLPVHVYDFQSPLISPDAAFGHPFVPAESTPKVDSQTLHTSGTISGKKNDSTERSLPTINDSNSFFDDLTSFFTTFSNVIAAHPELSEGVCNILRNTLNGTYWHAHRDEMSQTLHDISRETGVAAEALRKEAEEAAKRRVANALEGIFQSLSGIGVSSSSESTSTQSTGRPEPEKPVPANEAPSRPEVPSQGPGHLGHRGSPLPFPPPFIPSQNQFPYFRHVPPPPHFGRTFRDFSNWPPPPPPVPVHYVSVPPLPTGPYFAPPGPPPPPMETPTARASKPTPHELRAQVDEAKARYREEKEKYRLDREERRKGREMRSRRVSVESDEPAASFPFARPKTPPVIAVQGRHNQPSYEVVNRRHTYLGHGRHGYDQSDLRTRTINRIAKRLADMGFSESTYPDLPNKIKAQIPIGGVVRNDSEDDIVTTLLEDLLATAPKTPVASGSGGGREVPGAWH